MRATAEKRSYFEYDCPADKRKRGFKSQLMSQGQSQALALAKIRHPVSRITVRELGNGLYDF